MKIKKIENGDYSINTNDGCAYVIIPEGDGDDIEAFYNQCKTMCNEKCQVDYGGEDDQEIFWSALSPVYPEEPERHDILYGAEFLTEEVKIWNGDKGFSNGFLLQDGSIIRLMDHRDIRGFTSYLQNEYNIRTTIWEKDHPWITGIYTDSKWFEDTANAIRISFKHDQTTIEILSTHEVTEKQWKVIEDFCNENKIYFDVVDIRQESKEHTAYGHDIYTINFNESDRPKQMVAKMKKLLDNVKSGVINPKNRLMKE